MSLFQLSEDDELSSLKQLFEYVYGASVSDFGSVNHGFDSTWEQVCRFLIFFDPQGRVPGGFTPTKSRSQILQEIGREARSTLPCIEAFLDVALCVNDHRNGNRAKTLHNRMTFEPELHSILVSLELLTNDGAASKPLLLDAIDRWHFFDSSTNELTAEADAFLQKIAFEAWEQAPHHDREYLRANLWKNVSVSGWFSTRWHLGVWLKSNEKERFSDLFGSHGSLNWLVPKYIKRGLDETEQYSRS